MIGAQIAKIVESKHPDFPVGKRVIGPFGWRDRTVVGPKMLNTYAVQKTCIVPDIGDLPPSLVLGMLGMPG